MIDALIPIGSVVRPQGSDALLLVCGYYPDDGEQMYDYLAAPYPTGIASEQHVAFLDADAIAEVVATGYLDEQGERALDATAKLMNAREEAFIAIGRELERMGVVETDDGNESDGASDAFTMA